MSHPRRGGSVPVLRMVRVRICGAGFVFAVVVPDIPVVPVVAVRPLVGAPLRAQWGGGVCPPPAVCSAGVATASVFG